MILMRSVPHIFASARRAARVAAPYAAEIGRASFAALAVFTVAVVAMEFANPGVAASIVAPQVLVALLILAGGLALIDVGEHRRQPRRAFSIAAVVLAAGVAFLAAWQYFAGIPQVRARLAAAVAFAVALAALAAVHPPPDGL